MLFSGRGDPLPIHCDDLMLSFCLDITAANPAFPLDNDHTDEFLSSGFSRRLSPDDSGEIRVLLFC